MSDISLSSEIANFKSLDTRFPVKVQGKLLIEDKESHVGKFKIRLFI